MLTRWLSQIIITWSCLLISHPYSITKAVVIKSQRVPDQIAAILGVQSTISQISKRQNIPHSGGIHGLSHVLADRMLLRSVNESGVVRLTYEIEEGIIKVHPLWVVRGFFVGLSDGLAKPVDWPLLRVVATQYSKSKIIIICKNDAACI